jgi:uncharacterized repeat protein (TIGR03847 family)
LDLGLVSGLRAESFGEPGQRTFRLMAETAHGSVSLWLEKEQIVMLGSALAELLARVPSGEGLDPASDALESFRGELDVKVGSLTVGYDAAHRGFTVEAGDFDSPLHVGSISLLARRDQFVEMRKQIEGIVAAGRPRCVLCGTPLGGGPHFCPESNGHAHLTSADIG